jgi:uncharacterized membrane protein YidH (DUF202 family)
VSIASGFLTPSSLYVVAIINVVCGLVQVVAAPASRLPRTVRTAGFFAIAVGLLMAAAGYDRVQQVFAAWLSLGSTNIRIGALLVAAVGGTLVYGSARFECVPEFADLHDARTPQTIAR